MSPSSEMAALIATHILQFSVALLVVSVIVLIAARRWPHLAFLICMLALAKCVVPPVITSPAGFFTRTPGLAFKPHLEAWSEEKLLRVKRSGSTGTKATFGRSLALEIGHRSREFALAFCGFWLIGATTVLIRAWSQIKQLRRMLLQSRPAPLRLQRIAQSLQRQAGVRRSVEVLVSDDGFGPAAVGWFKPRLILPFTMVNEWSDRLLRPVVAHELIHVKRCDSLWGYLQFLAQIVWWFHPLIWWMGRRANSLCEKCCDDEVLARTNCHPADYAEALVAVLSLKSRFRSLPFCPTISPIEVTSERLKRLLDRRRPDSLRYARVNWAIVILLAAFVLPGMQWIAEREAVAGLEGLEAGSPTQREYRAELDRLLQSGQWDAAIRLLQPVVQQDPDNPGAVFYLGFALHGAGRLVEAVHYHRRAADFDQTKPVALYNWACALALQGKVEAALDKLEEAVTAGFVHRSDLRDDPDLISLFGKERFKKLRTRTNQQRQARQASRQLDFLNGDWTIIDESRTEVGNCRFHLKEGRVVQGNWTGIRETAGTSVFYYQPASQTWKLVWVSEGGTVTEYEGLYRDATCEFKGTLFTAGGDSVLCRMRITQTEAGSVEHHIERSSDGGATWETHFRGILIRRSLCLEVAQREKETLQDLLALKRNPVFGQPTSIGKPPRFRDRQVTDWLISQRLFQSVRWSPLASRELREIVAFPELKTTCEPGSQWHTFFATAI